MNTSIQSLRNQGEQLAAERRWGEAIRCFELILQRAPNDASAMLQLSYLHSLAGSYRQGRHFAMLAHAAKPVQQDVIAELISRLRTFNEPQAILENIRRLGRLDNVSIPLLLQFAQRLSFLNLQPMALRFIDEAKRGDPGYPPTLSARAQVLTYLGRFEEAEGELKRCLALAPDLAQPYWLLSRLRKWTVEDNHVGLIRQQLQRSGRTPDDVALLNYALHKELDDLQIYGEAWDALTDACRSRRSQISYRTEDSQALVDSLVAMPHLPVAGGPGAATATTTTPTTTPIFIVGMHRSGTTLLEQILAGHDEVVDMGELYDFTSQMRWACDHHCRGVIDLEIVKRAPAVDFSSVGSGYLEGISWRLAGKRFAVDKLPSNFLNLGFILTALPHARVLHMVRDPMETCFSNLRELFSDACPYSYDQQEMAEFYALYRELMAHWHARFPGRILDVHYDRLVRDTETCVRGIADYCGLGFQPPMLEISSPGRAVATASAVQVRGGIEWRAVPKWQAYTEGLQPLARRLAALGIT